MRPAPWRVLEWDECGGYDCITPAIEIVDANGDRVCVIDAGDHGWGAVARGDTIAEHREQVRRDVFDLASVIVEAVNKRALATR